jgi:hypothetical protein
MSGRFLSLPARRRSRFRHIRRLLNLEPQKTFSAQAFCAIDFPLESGAKGKRLMRASGLVLACAAMFMWAAGAQEALADGPVKSVMKLFGFATDVDPPADFVQQSRPAKEGDYVPIFQPPPEPQRPLLNDKQFKAVKSDLDSVQKQHDGLRSSFPPSAKAVAEAQAEQQKRAAAKAAKPSAPQQ